MIPVVIQRVLLACGAIAGVVVLAIWLHSTHLESQARAFKPSPAHPVTQAQIDRALSQFEGARKNNPDTRPDVEEATILTFLGHDARATAMLRNVVRDEPRNALAWAQLSVATRSSDPALSAAAVARFRELVPPLPR